MADLPSGNLKIKLSAEPFLYFDMLNCDEIFVLLYFARGSEGKHTMISAAIKASGYIAKGIEI